MFSTGIFLKLFSFHHVVYDNRCLLNKIFKLSVFKNPTNPQISKILNISLEQLEIALQYPRNLSYSHFLRYICAPTCCYQLKYPLVDKIRISFILKRFGELVIGNILQAYLLWQHMIPTAEAAIKPIKDRDYLMILNLTL